MNSSVQVDIQSDIDQDTPETYFCEFIQTIVEPTDLLAVSRRYLIERPYPNLYLFQQYFLNHGTIAEGCSSFGGKIGTLAVHLPVDLDLASGQKTAEGLARPGETEAFPSILCAI